MFSIFSETFILFLFFTQSICEDSEDTEDDGLSGSGITENHEERQKCLGPVPPPPALPICSTSSTSPATTAATTTGRPPPPTTTKSSTGRPQKTSTASPTKSTTPSSTQFQTQTTSSSKATTTTQSIKSTTPSSAAVEGDEPENGDDIRKSDPFYRTPEAQPVNCTDAGADCTTCPWTDWLKLFNKSIDASTSPPFQRLENTDQSKCFQHCNSTPASCVLFTFNRTSRTCNIYSSVAFEDVKNDTSSTLFSRIAPRFLFLDEWVITSNLIPDAPPMQTFSNVNFLNCTLLCANHPNCSIATLDKGTKTCSLFPTWAAQILALKSNNVAIQHLSLFRTDSLWRYAILGNIFQEQESPVGFTTRTMDDCLKNCDRNVSCQLATTVASRDGAVDCYIYEYLQDKWFQDVPPSKAPNSYFKLVSRNNTMFRRLPHFRQVASTMNQPVEVTQTENVDACHRYALKSIRRISYYSYNSRTGSCNLYENSVKMHILKTSDSYDVTTFSKSIPTDYLPYYAYESLWIARFTTEGEISNRNASSGDECLGLCLKMTKCTSVAIQRPEGNCSLLTLKDLNATYIEHDSSNFTGIYSTQLFVKSRDIGFIDNTASGQSRCLQKPLISWDQINQILQADSLNNSRNEIPPGNNAPTEPHGGNFEGQGSGTPEPEPSQKSQRSRNLENFDLDGAALRWEKLTAESVAKTYLTDVGAGAIIGYNIGRATGDPKAAGAGGVIGAVGGAIVATGKVVINALVCFFGGCETKKKGPCDEDENLLKRSDEQPKSRKYHNISRDVGLRATQVCTDEPTVNGGNPSLQQTCAGTPRRGTCPICCKVGRDPEYRFTQCDCVDSRGLIWIPDPVNCVDRAICSITATLRWSTGYMPLIPVTDCSGQILYYGVAFNQDVNIPFYAVFHFTLANRVKLSGIDRDGIPWEAYPCLQNGIITSQLGNGHYTAMPVPIDKGHLCPAEDFVYTDEAVTSTFFYINAAPQDRFSNRGPWKAVEIRLRKLFSGQLGGGSRDGYVIAGTCLNFTDFNNKIPWCYWKMVCTTDDSGAVTVAAFYHENSPAVTDGPGSQKEARRRQFRQVRNQGDFETLLGFDNIREIWDEIEHFYPNGRARLQQCKTAPCINFPNINIPPCPMMKADGDGDSLYRFWNDKVMGDEYDQEVDIALGENESDFGQSSSGTPPSCGKKVVGYVTGWSDVRFGNVAASYLTHVIFAFIQVKPDGTLVVGTADPDNSKDVEIDRKKSYLRLHEIKAAKDNSGGRLNTVFAVGGWANSQYFSGIAGNPGLTQNFIRSALEIIDIYDMDGIDIDWEYPVSGGAQNGVKQDKENYLTFLSAIRSALDKHQEEKGRGYRYSLSIAGAAGAWVLDDGFDLPKIAEIVDWINVMTYDFFGAWDSQWGAFTGPHAPLYFGAPKSYSGKLNVDFTMKYYTCRIKNPEKLVMGLGFYGRYWNFTTGDDPVWRKATANGAGGFDGGFEPWRNIARNYLENSAYQKAFHDKTQTPYLSTSGGFFMGYEDPQSISEKVKYAAAKNFGGVMMWAVDLDDGKLSMIRTASSEALCSGSSGEIPSDYKCSPIQEKRWWTLQDEDGRKAGMCGKLAPLYNGYYPVCDPEDPGYACCSPQGYCGSEDDHCACDGCVDYFQNPEKILDEPIKPRGPVRWHTLDKVQPGQPGCGYEGNKLENGDYAICNPDDNNAYCCSKSGYCGKGGDYCDCQGCVNFRENPDYSYPPKTWIDEGPNRGRCGEGFEAGGQQATCDPNSNDHCCSSGGYCGSTSDHCNCDGCHDFGRK